MNSCSGFGEEDKRRSICSWGMRTGRPSGARTVDIMFSRAYFCFMQNDQRDRRCLVYDAMLASEMLVPRR